MKFAPYFTVMALFYCVANLDATPYGNGKYTDSKFFEGTLDDIQGAIEDMLLAGEDLEVLERKLEELVNQKHVIFDAEAILEAAVNATGYNDIWKHDN